MALQSGGGVHTRVPAGDVVDADVVVVGAGVAGLVHALDLGELRPGVRVVLLDKAVAGAGGSTPLAQGGLAAAVGADDSPALHAADTLGAGDGLCDPAAVAVLAAEAPSRVADLVRRGVRFDRAAGGTLHLAREGAQSVPRCVHSADATGAEMFRALRAAVVDTQPPPLTRLQGIACSLATTRENGRERVSGVWALLDETDGAAASRPQDGGLTLLRAHAVVLATGGCGGLYVSTTNRAGVTGDGVALAYEAGAALADLEFVQFHPTGLRAGTGGSGSRLLLTEALRGAGAVLVDGTGRRFAGAYHPDAELAPRHVVTAAILDQPGGAWLDATALGRERLAAEFPTVLEGALAHGYDLATEPVPVEPTQHYLVGGVATDLDGATTLPGLYAIGEVACTGVHGANRMAGNSLAEACVFAHRAARALAARLDADHRLPAIDHEPVFSRAAGAYDEARSELRAAMSTGAGAVRNRVSLERADKGLDRAESLLGPSPALARDAVELAHACRVARLIVRSARLRTESRGVHVRDDAGQHEEAWAGVRLRVQRPAMG